MLLKANRCVAVRECAGVLVGVCKAVVGFLFNAVQIAHHSSDSQLTDPTSLVSRAGWSLGQRN